MFVAIKKMLPRQVREWLRPLKIELLDNRIKRKLSFDMQKKHKELLVGIKGKKKIKVVFLAIHKSVWKVDPVFQKMLVDPYFDPLVLVCPYTAYGKDRMWEDMRECLAYFKEKGYPTYSSYNDVERHWIKLDEIAPDVVFFTNPHNLTRKEYYEEVYLNYLTCYVPYAYEVSQYAGNQSQYNQSFHNAMWKIFTAHDCSKLIYETVSANRGKNVTVTGYPGVEEFSDCNNSTARIKWKAQSQRKVRIIWAPHHTIDSPEIPYSNFLKYCEFFRQLATKYESATQWAFKPHPILKSKLYRHVEWGIEKTDKYFEFWANRGNTQLELGEYADLFLESDAMIHDSGSFLAEYLFVEKPVLYLVATASYQNYYNDFGKEALAACRLADDEESILRFVESLIADALDIKVEHKLFLERYCFERANSPSMKILNEVSEGIVNS